jgi:hypothetical protein
MLKAFEGSHFFKEVRSDGLSLEISYVPSSQFSWDQLNFSKHIRSINLDDMLSVMHLCPWILKYIGSHTLTDVFMEILSPSALPIHYTKLPCRLLLENRGKGVTAVIALRAWAREAGTEREEGITGHALTGTGCLSVQPDEVNTRRTRSSDSVHRYSLVSSLSNVNRY